MFRLRKLNTKGLKEFGQFLDGCYKQNTVGEIPFTLLKNGATSEDIKDQIDLDDDVTFKSRYEMGLYLTEKFEKINMQPYLGDEGFWSAIALIWFEQLTLKRRTEDGSEYKINKPPNYKYDKSFGEQMRHAIYTTWRLVNEHKENAMFLLKRDNDIPTRGDLTEQLMGTQKYINLKSVIETASRLYGDKNSNTGYVTGATRAPEGQGGDMRRYVAWLKQINLNYDLYTIKTNALLKLLPSEFDRFLNR